MKEVAGGLKLFIYKIRAKQMLPMLEIWIYVQVSLNKNFVLILHQRVLVEYNNEVDQ